MFTIKSVIEFDMAHFLSGYDGKCSNIHGHRYKVVAKIRSKELKNNGQLRGMVEDFGVFKDALKRIASCFDHKLVIEDNDEGREVRDLLQKSKFKTFDIVMVNYRVTAEEMSRDIFNRLRDMKIDVSEIELFETPNNSCIYTED